MIISILVDVDECLNPSSLFAAKDSAESLLPCTGDKDSEGIISPMVFLTSPSPAAKKPIRHYFHTRHDPTSKGRESAVIK